MASAFSPCHICQMPKTWLIPKNMLSPPMTSERDALAARAQSGIQSRDRALLMRALGLHTVASLAPGWRCFTDAAQPQCFSALK